MSYFENILWIYYMNNFKNRALYFELENSLLNCHDFTSTIRTVRLISNWASEQLGYDIHEAEAYARANIANIVRENQIEKMIKRIEHDLIDHNIDTNDEVLLDESRNLLQEIHEKLRKARD